MMVLPLTTVLGSCSLPLGSVNLRRKLRLTRSDLYFSKPHENIVMKSVEPLAEQEDPLAEYI